MSGPPDVSPSRRVSIAVPEASTGIPAPLTSRRMSLVGSAPIRQVSSRRSSAGDQVSSNAVWDRSARSASDAVVETVDASATPAGTGGERPRSSSESAATAPSAAGRKRYSRAASLVRVLAPRKPSVTASYSLPSPARRCAAPHRVDARFSRQRLLCCHRGPAYHSVAGTAWPSPQPRSIVGVVKARRAVSPHAAPQRFAPLPASAHVGHQALDEPPRLAHAGPHERSESIS